MKEIEIGVKMKVETGPSITGMDVLRELQRNGYEIVDIKKAAVTMEKTGEEDEDTVQMYFSGGIFTVVLRQVWHRKFLDRLPRRSRERSSADALERLAP